MENLCFSSVSFFTLEHLAKIGFSWVGFFPSVKLQNVTWVRKCHQGLQITWHFSSGWTTPLTGYKPVTQQAWPRSTFYSSRRRVEIDVLVLHSLALRGVSPVWSARSALFQSGPTPGTYGSLMFPCCQMPAGQWKKICETSKLNI